MNDSKSRKVTKVAIGDYVLIRNFCKRLKFDPNFGPDCYKVVEVSLDRPVVTVLDDVKHTKQPQRNCEITERMQIEEFHR